MQTGLPAYKPSVLLFCLLQGPSKGVCSSKGVHTPCQWCRTENTQTLIFIFCLKYLRFYSLCIVYNVEKYGISYNLKNKRNYIYWSGFLLTGWRSGVCSQNPLAWPAQSPVYSALPLLPASGPPRHDTPSNLVWDFAQVTPLSTASQLSSPQPLSAQPKQHPLWESFLLLRV